MPRLMELDLVEESLWNSWDGLYICLHSTELDLVHTYERGQTS